MADYYDKEKFTGGQQPPPKKKKNDDDWNWVVIILLFCTGMWPLALLWMGWKWLFGGRETPEEKVRRAQAKMDSAIDSALRGVDSALDSARRGVDSAEKSVSTAARGFADALDSAARPRETAKPAVKTAPKASRTEAEPKKEKKGKKTKSAILRKIEATAGSSVFLQFLGALFLFGGTIMMAAVIDDFELPALIVTINVLLGGGVMLGKGIQLRRFSRRSRRYLAAVGEADSLSIDLIARRVGRTQAQAVKDLQKMIDRGYFGEDAYLDLDLGYFLRFNSAAEQRRSAPSSAQPEEATPREAAEGYSGVLRRIRAANDRIADEVLSAKIDRLEQITGQILKEVEEHPEKRSKMNTFFDYYLPTTQKLLDAYADFEETGVEGENLRSAKQRIEQTMDSIVDGFAHQLDQLYRADAMDVATDIKVMESMLHRDTSSAARDFGYDQQGQA